MVIRRRAALDGHVPSETGVSRHHIRGFDKKVPDLCAATASQNRRGWALGAGDSGFPPLQWGGG